MVCCSEVFGSCDIANDEYKEDWKYMMKDSMKHAMEKYTSSKLKMIKVYIGLPDPKDDSGEKENSENSQDEMSEGERSEGEKSEGESSEADADACTCFLRIINDFGDFSNGKCRLIKFSLR